MFVLLEIVIVLAACVPLILALKRRGIEGGRLLVLKLIAAAVVVVVVAWNAYLGVYVNWHWFDSKGYLDVFRTRAGLKWLMFACGFSVSFAAISVNLKLALATVRDEPSDTEIALLASVVPALIMGIAMSGLWSAWLPNRHQVTSEIADPVFGRSISYYLFSLPWKAGLLSWLMALAVVAFFALLVLHLTSLVVAAVRRKNKNRVEKVSYARIIRQLFVIAAAWAFLLALRQGLDIDKLVFSTSGVVVGAGYTDLHARIWGIRIARIIWIAVSLLLVVCSVQSYRRRVFYGRDGKVVPGRIIAAPAGVAALLLLANIVIPGIQQATRVSPDELKAETPYIEHNMRFTRTAYAIAPEDIEEREIGIGRQISPEVVEANRKTLASIRLWDYRVLQDHLKEHQEIKPYYEFHDVDIDRYNLRGEPRQVMLAVRELETSQLDSRAATWVNRTFKYTHGYGLAMAPVNEFLSGGTPNLFIRNIPSEVSAPELAVKTPQIYYGELTSTDVITAPSVDEFDYPAGEDNAYSHYAGTGGIRLDSGWKRLCLAWWLNSHQMVFSPDVNRDSRLHMVRRIAAIVRKIAPWLRYDNDPYAVISEGRIKWIWDAYTVSGNYPYSAVYAGSAKEYAGINYIRNAVKVVIDGYDGSVDFFVVDEKDPIVRTYRRAFPSMFKSAAAMPADIRAHLRYPEDLFTIQLEMYGTYQMRNTQVFYTKEDVWERPREKYRQSDDVVVEPYYVTALLPGESRPQFILMSPYTPRAKNVLRSWICGCSDGESYGKLIVYKFPKGEEIKGPRMIESRIDQDSEMSQVLSLWDQKGSRVLRGNLLVVPLFLKDKAYLLYVEPIYLQAEGAKMPELKKIVVADQERIVWGDTFQESMEGLTRMRPGIPAAPAGAVEVKDTGELARILAPLRAGLDRYKSLQGEGKFAEAGSELERIEKLIQRLISGN